MEWEDKDNLATQEVLMRRSMQFDRKKVNHKVDDVAETGVVVDPFHSETAEAISNIDSGRSDGMRDSKELKLGASVRDSRD